MWSPTAKMDTSIDHQGVLPAPRGGAACLLEKPSTGVSGMADSHCVPFRFLTWHRLHSCFVSTYCVTGTGLRQTKPWPPWALFSRTASSTWAPGSAWCSLFWLQSFLKGSNYILGETIRMKLRVFLSLPQAGPV